MPTIEKAAAGWFSKTAHDYGAPTAIVAALLMIGLSTAYWVGTNIVKPWSDTTLKVMDDQAKTNANLTESVHKQVQVSEENARNVESIDANQKLLLELYREQQRNRGK